MWRYLLDTNIASYLSKGLSPALQHRARVVPRTSLLISSITEAEMLYGLELLPSNAKLRLTVPRFLASMEIAPWDSDCARQYAPLAATQKLKGASLSILDTMIAAHALALDLTLVTHDKAFTRIPGLAVEDWTLGPQGDSQTA